MRSSLHIMRVYRYCVGMSDSEHDLIILISLVLF